MADASIRVGSPADIVVTAAPLLMGTVLAVSLRSTRDEDHVWRDLGAGALGTSSVLPFVLIVVLGVVVGLAMGRRRGPAHLRAIRAAGVTAAVAGAAVGGVHVAARLTGEDGQGELIASGGVIARVLVAAIVAGVIAAPLAMRRLTPAAAATTTTVLLAIFVLPWTAAFDDNSLHPTSSRLSLVAVLLPLLVSVVPTGRLRAVGGLAFAGAIALLGVALGALPWILDDAMACHDDDCVPLPLAVSWLLVGGLWWGAAAIGGTWNEASART